jgi:hypothetical protein
MAPAANAAATTASHIRVKKSWTMGSQDARSRSAPAEYDGFLVTDISQL